MERKEVAKRIKELREAKKLKKNALANIAGISPTYLSQLEKGEKSPTIEYLDHICWGLGITLEEFFHREGELPLVDRINALTPEQKQLLNQFLNSL